MQYGGPNGELGESLRYLSQRYSMPLPELKGLLTDIGTEELGHLEMIGTIVHQLTKNLTEKQIEENPGFAAYFVDHTAGVYPAAASGFPWNAASIQSTGDPIADLNENLAAEQKARITYDNILRLVDDPDVIEPIKFLREREIVHYQRFGEALRLLTDKMNSKNFYAFNPGFDGKKQCALRRRAAAFSAALRFLNSKKEQFVTAPFCVVFLFYSSHFIMVLPNAFLVSFSKAAFMSATVRTVFTELIRLPR